MKTDIRNPRQKSHLHALCCALTSATLILAGSFSASAFTAADATTCYNAWWNTFNGASIGWWTGAETIEMVEDVGNTSHINTMCNKFTSANGTSWSGNSFNDDIAWGCIAFVRAYTATGNTTYRTIAKNNFDMMYARAWDTSAGGLFWNTSKNSKNACVNFPASIAAHLLSIALNDSSYATKSQNIFNWGKANFFVSSSGLVKDSLTSSSAYSYNLGTFMGAAFYNGDSADATTAGNYVKNTWGNNMQVPDSTTGDGAGFNGICLRWMAIAGYNTSYRQAVANNAWSRRNANNLVNCQWDRQTGSGSQDSWSCTDVVVAMKTVSPDSGGGGSIAGTHTVVNQQNGLAIDNGSSTVQGAGMMQWGVNGGSAQKWTFTQNSDTSWNIISQYSGQALDDGNTSANGAQMVQWGANGGSNQKWWVDVQSDGSYKIWNQASSGALDNGSKSANGSPLIQWGWNGGSQQKWKLQ